jgi:hypothetical protein
MWDMPQILSFYLAVFMDQNSWAILYSGAVALEMILPVIDFFGWEKLLVVLVISAFFYFDSSSFS